MIRAKLRVFNVEKFNDTECIRMEAVYSEDKESVNYSWSQATPAATLTMNISNPAARNKFKVGKEFYLDFTEA